MTTKKEHSKQTRLSIEDRVKILERLDNGEKAVSLAPEYKVSTSAIANIKRSKENLLKQRNSLIMCQGKTSKKRCTGVENSRLDQMLYEWYIAERDIGTHVTGPMLRKKALQLNKTLNGPETFKASAGFLNKFKERHDIVLIRAEKDVDEEQNSTVQDASDDSCQEMIDDNEKQENWEILDQQVNLPEQYEDDIDHEENEENEEVEIEIENKEYLDDSFDNDLTAKNAFNAINAYISWYQNQNYCSPEDWQYLWKFWKHSLNQTLLTKKI
ncbi:jerky protein-like [Nylanderia fulva]|uniref:jerky protein-like n=1 Tax=Nylanderia fulva TaxID=613905 RepID=UPI0010FB6F99|nr:jerky protein-like [Nylanderia fulva]XP_029175058.1 jerky protein-like [Nylanderia fulva]